MPFKPKYPFNAMRYDDDTVGEVIGPENTYADDHYFVRRYPTLMVNVNDGAISDRAVERATAEPGERRPVGRPRRDIADL